MLSKFDAISCRSFTCSAIFLLAADANGILSFGTEGKDIVMYVQNPGEGCEIQCQVGTSEAEKIVSFQTEAGPSLLMWFSGNSSDSPCSEDKTAACLNCFIFRYSPSSMPYWTVHSVENKNTSIANVRKA